MQCTGSAALVTGGASGLGAATARTLAARGARVFALDLPAGVETATAAGGVADGVTLVPADVTDPLQVRAAVEQVTASGLPLRVAVNCAGIAPGARVLSRSGPHDVDLFRRVVEVNLVGTFAVVVAAAEAMAAAEPGADGQRGVIVNTASVAAFDGQIGQAAYSASKAAVAGMTLPLARDLASSGIRVVTIAPGIVDTPLLAGVDEDFRAGLAASVPFPKRLCRPDEFAQLVAMVVEHDYLNGETIRMDGALRMAPR
ncbi:NAD(P)-dependent dehydrogenase (short-subunit alcohol dehydrogenase family) [Kineococcus xinjiangensis]|uniref:NAD(P)-dependent dehydrogenase (Short-subunit alcohol dehydrogenase family) n=1 Tax=Kineococcus xinjiangensis TaxID=512762 RepID=A0A2S6IU54_9ACTN|nr:SDR family NAD(P)-dependent oxidoreductase [Kineococcus xinjiangensis]PPK97748.1 NAD(P)-dependent dehydrogenase (short-subunit alcohol dehydrogenase family) [Kineococcus xinjiangensis]